MANPKEDKKNKPVGDPEEVARHDKEFEAKHGTGGRNGGADGT